MLSVEAHSIVHLRPSGTIAIKFDCYDCMLRRSVPAPEANRRAAFGQSLGVSVGNDGKRDERRSLDLAPQGHQCAMP